ncbi:enoyl-CoA hydratase/isomerase family protein [Imbroritus primus]|uniref:Enoyl-CoA hydratase/isomerase family protein n=1 Tax=Imbroritus primus TaxID=3058603 RepID=A0ACD3STY5_9BURK|nr:enoyl-CoA hydratase/isomerase family protein [Burkholderiaceae bacterium PBA]
MEFSTLTVTTAGHIATVSLNRPEVRNAFNETLIAELTGAFRALGDSPQVRVIVLTGAGLAFCAGADLNWMRRMAGYAPDENRADALTLAQMMHTIWSCPRPVIARVQGDAYAGGVGLVAVADIVIAADTANFSISETRLGLIPATISPYVIRAMGEQAARRYCLSAERFSAAQAAHSGLVHEVVPAAALDARVAELAATLAANSPEAMRACKQLIQDVAGVPIDTDLITDTANRIAEIRGSAEGREGISAFLEKRQPAWRNA